MFYYFFGGSKSVISKRSVISNPRLASGFQENLSCKTQMNVCAPLPMINFIRMNSDYFINKREYTSNEIANWVTGLDAACAANPAHRDGWYRLRQNGLARF